MNIANRYLEALPKKYRVKQAYLFGSFAKNSQHPDSDIDIAVVVDKLKYNEKTDLDFMTARRKIDLRIEPHTFRQVDFHKLNPLVNEILKYGIRLK